MVHFKYEVEVDRAHTTNFEDILMYHISFAKKCGACILPGSMAADDAGDNFT